MYNDYIAEEFKVSETRRKRNKIADEISDMVKLMKDMKKAGKKEEEKQAGKRMKELTEEGKELKKMLQIQESKLSLRQAQLYDEARHVPNDTAPDVPVGEESNAGLVEIVGTKLENSDHVRYKDHVELATLHDIADFDRAGKVAGTGFYYLKNAGAMLELALTRYAVDYCIRRGFVPVTVPDLIRHEVLEACGFNPRSDDPQTYYVNTSAESAEALLSSSDAGNSNGGGGTIKFNPMRLVLSATAEFPLASMYANEVIQRPSLPLKMVGVGRAFRAEGLAGAINRGLYRVHQFQKVEMFALTSSQKGASDEMLEEFREIQRSLFNDLDLCFRVLNMPTQDLGAPAYKKYDMEAWMPGRKSWGEVS
jgi:seryl-tRNA synthetase